MFCRKRKSTNVIKGPKNVGKCYKLLKMLEKTFGEKEDREMLSDLQLFVKNATKEFRWVFCRKRKCTNVIKGLKKIEKC